MTKWTEADASDQAGRRFVVTGANSGIGYEVSRMLAGLNARVVMACRSLERGEAARDRIRRAGGEVELMPLDLADLESVSAFADAYRAQHERLDGLVNNAGLMALPRLETRQGFEMQFGVNHLGHFALTSRLLPRLRETPGSRVVSVSSEVHRQGRIDFDDLMGERRYSRWGAYMQSKLANILFTRRLQRFFEEEQVESRAVACHPGYASTELQGRSNNPLENFFFKQITNRLVAQSPQMGALPTLRAVVDPAVPGGGYVGPKTMFGARGYPELMTPSAAALDDAVAERLWRVSEELVGHPFSPEG